MEKKLLKILFFCILFVVIASGIKRTYTMSKYNITEHTLNNGLKVFLIKDPSSSLISVRNFVKTGSLYEEEYLGAGISHYLEHVVAGGSTSLKTEEEYKTTISLIGGAFNAYTTTDHTCYYINTTQKHAYDAISLIYEWMFHCSFNEKEVKRERKVIIKEIERNNANISRQFYQLCQHNFYKYHPMQLPTIGYLTNFKSLKRSDLMSYYKKHYIPNNMVLVIGGNFKEDKLMEQLEHTFGTIPKYAPSKTIKFNEPPPFSSRTVTEEGTTNVTNVSIRFATVDLFSQDLYPLDLLEFILGNGEQSLLYKTLVEDKKLAYSISCASYTPAETTGFFDISLEIDYKNLNAAKKVILEIINNIKKGHLDTNFIERAKKQKLAEDIFSIATIEDIVSRTGQSYVYTHTPDFFNYYINSFKKINKDQIVKAAKKYFLFDKIVLSVLKPNQKKSVRKTTTVTTDKPTKKPKLIKLENGIKILLYEEKSLPRVHAKVFVLGGLRAETSTNNGIGHLDTELLGKGSQRYSKDFIQKIIEDRGANLSASLGKNTLYYNLDCLSEDLNDLLPILFHSFLKPKYEYQDLDEIKRQTYQAIKQRKDDWYGYCKYLFNKTYFQSHPFSLSPLGEIKSIKHITLKDILSYHKSILDPKSMIISVFGDYDENKVLEIINFHFSKIQKSTKSKDFLKPLARKAYTQKNLYEYSIPQNVAAIFISFDGETLSQVSNNLQLDLIDSVLSGMNYPGGRLHNILREKGLVYVVHGINLSGIEKGYFFIWALTSKENINIVKNIILNEIDKLKTELISDEEFKQALGQLNFYYMDRVSAIDSLSIITSVDELYKRGFDHYSKINKYIKKLTKKDLLKAAKKYLVNPQIFVFQNKIN